MTSKTATITVLAALIAASVSAQNLVTNPGFETPSVGGSFTSSSADSTGLTGWTVDTTPGDGVQQFAAGNVVNNGSQTLQLTDLYNVGGGIRQTIPTQVGTQYTVSIDVASRANNAVIGYFNFGGQVHQLSATSVTFTTLSWQVTATSSSTLIDIYGTNNAGTYQMVIDNVSVTPPAGPVSSTNSTITPSSSWIPADGTTVGSVTVTLKDNSGNPVAGKTVSLASSRGAADSISPASGTSSAAGNVTFTVTSTSLGLAILTATDVTDNLTLSSTASLTLGTADAHGPQADPNPIVFDQAATNDNLVVLTAASSEYSSRLSLIYSGASYYPKYFWFNNWNNGTNDYMKWNVALATGAVYHVYAKLSAGTAVPLQLSITGTNTVLNCATRNIGWDKLDCGTISIPAGTNQLVLRRNTTNTTDTISIISLELIRESDQAAYEQRLAAFRADTTWFSKSKYGLMTQFGAWGYPPSGPQPSLNDFANNFDVPKFVNLVTNTGSKYVIWSLTWYTYQMLAPIQSVQNIVPGNTNLTSVRDVVGEVAAALHAQGVRFILYYHCGQDSHLGYNSTDWWKAQQFPAVDHTDRGAGDRSTFFTNWINVMTEVGNRYGTRAFQ